MAILVVVLEVAIGSVLLYSHVLRKETESLLRNSYELSSAVGPSVTLRMIQQRFGSELKRFPGCPESECVYDVAVSNRLLAAVHLVPYTEMRSYFNVRDGVVNGNMLDYTVNVRNRSIVAHVQIDLCKTCDSFSLHPWNDASPLDTNGLVQIGSASSAEKKRRVLSFDLNCMTKHGGCSTVSELLPTVWESKDGKIACRIPNREGFVDYPSDWYWLRKQ
jgi:hypothetical protein